MSAEPGAPAEEPPEQQFRALLVLQQDIDAKVDEFITRVKSILAAERDAKGGRRVIVELNGELYELNKERSETRFAIDLARKHHGFYHDYRLVHLGKAIK
jgi:hypothetical protein